MTGWVKSPEDGAKPEAAGPGVSVRNPLASSEAQASPLHTNTELTTTSAMEEEQNHLDTATSLAKQINIILIKMR